MTLCSLPLEKFDFFLSYIFYQKNFPVSKLEGLHRRFPGAWVKGETLPLFHHHELTSFSLEDEFRQRVAYCLCAESNHNPELLQALKEAIFSFEPKLVRKLKELKQRQGFVAAEDLILEPLQREIPRVRHYCTTAYLVFLCEHLGLTFSESFQSRLIALWNSKIKDSPMFFFNGGLKAPGRTNVFPVESKLRDKRKPLTKLMAGVYDIYTEQLGEDVASWLTQKLKEPHPYSLTAQEQGLIAFNRAYNLYDPSTCDLTRLDVLVIMTQLLLDTYSILTQEEVEEEDSPFAQVFWLAMNDDVSPHVLKATLQNLKLLILLDPIGKQYISEIEERLFSFALTYCQSRIVEANRQFFYRHYSMQDKVSIRSLQSELSKAQQQVKALSQEINQQKQQAQSLKQTLIKQTELQLKTLTQSHLEQERLIKKLQLELEEAKDENKALREELSVTPSSESPKLLEAPREALIEHFNHPDVLIIGGHPNVVLKLKEILPHCRFYECETSIKDDFLKGIRLAFVQKIWVNHGMVYKVRKLNPTLPIFEVDATNPERILRQMEAALV